MNHVQDRVWDACHSSVRLTLAESAISDRTWAASIIIWTATRHLHTRVAWSAREQASDDLRAEQ